MFKKHWPYIALILAHLIWGANFLVAKVTLQEFPPMSLAFLRFALASLLLAPFFLSETKKMKIEKKDLPRLIAIPVFIITLNITFFFEGIKRTTVTDASVLTLIIPVLSVFLGWSFLKEKITLLNLSGIALGFIGALIIVGLPQILFGKLSLMSLIGNSLIVLASISWVIGAIIAKSLLKKYSSLVITAISFMVGTVTFFAPAAIEYIQDPFWINQVTILGFLGLAYMTLLSSISAYFLFEWSLSKTSVIFANLFQYIEPFVASSLAILILEEEFSFSFLLGAALIVVGVTFGTLAREVHHRRRAHRI